MVTTLSLSTAQAPAGYPTENSNNKIVQTIKQ